MEWQSFLGGVYIAGNASGDLEGERVCLAGTDPKGPEEFQVLQDLPALKDNRDRESRDHGENQDQPDLLAREARTDHLARGVIEVPKEYTAFKGCMVATGVMGRKGPPDPLVLLGLRARPGEMAVMAGKGPQGRAGGMIDRVWILGTPKITISLVIFAIREHHHRDVHIDATPTILLLERHLGISKSL